MYAMRIGVWGCGSQFHFLMTTFTYGLEKWNTEHEWINSQIIGNIDKTVLTILLLSQESNGPSDAYAAISNADRLQAEPESLRKWREEQRERLEELGKHPEERFIIG